MALNFLDVLTRFLNQNAQPNPTPPLLPSLALPSLALPSLPGAPSPSPLRLGPEELQQQLRGDNPLLRLGSPSPGTFMLEPRVLQDMMPAFEQLLPFIEEFKRQGVPTVFPKPGESFDTFDLLRALQRAMDLHRGQERLQDTPPAGNPVL